MIIWITNILTSNSPLKLKKNNNFSFLDVKISRENNKFTTFVFRKPTFSGAFTNFDSFIPISYKHGLVNTLIFHCFKIFSSYEKLHNEIVYLKGIFKCKWYSNDFVGLCIKRFFDKLYITNKIYQTVEKKQLFIILPFLGHLSFETRNRLKSCIRNQLPSCSKKVFLNTFARILFINFRVVAATQLIMVNLRDTFLYEPRSIWESLHWHRNGLKIPKSLPLWTIFYYKVIMLHTMTFRFSFPKTISLNYTLRSHYWLKKINRNSIETFTPIP